LALTSSPLPSGSSWTAATSASDSINGKTKKSSKINTLLNITTLFLFMFFNLILNAPRTLDLPQVLQDEKAHIISNVTQY
jgi:hypothetical protein